MPKIENIIDTMLRPDEKLGSVRFSGEGIKAIHIVFSRIGKSVYARSVISALHNGDKAMSVVQTLIKTRSQELRTPIIHQDTPWNKASAKMFKRHGYKKTGVDRWTRYEVYEKKYE